MVDRESIVPIGMEAVYDEIHYSPAVRVGRTIYISGQIGRDENHQIITDSEAQIVQAFENLKKVVEAAGATMHDIVDLTTFHTDMRDLTSVHEGQGSVPDPRTTPPGRRSGLQPWVECRD